MRRMASSRPPRTHSIHVLPEGVPVPTVTAVMLVARQPGKTQNRCLKLQYENCCWTQKHTMRDLVYIESRLLPGQV